VSVEAAPMEPVISYQILDLKDGNTIVGQRLLLDSTQSKGSDIDFSQARWSVPTAGGYSESPTQIGPTAVYNLTGIKNDAVLTVSLTLNRRNGTDPLTVTKVIRISGDAIADTKLKVNQSLSETSVGKAVTLDILKSTGPGIEWDKTLWNIDGAAAYGPSAIYMVPASGVKPIVRYTVTAYLTGGTVLSESGEIKGLSAARIAPVITVESRNVINGETVLELSVRQSEGVNIDWERSHWYLYDGSENVTQLTGSSVVHSYDPTNEAMGYPVMVEMYMKNDSTAFVGYRSVDVAEDVFTPVISTQQGGSDKNCIVFSAVNSRGSGIQWGNAKWSFGDSSEVQYGQTATHIYGAQKGSKTYTVSLTLTRGAGTLAETKTVFKDVAIGADKIKPVITVTKMGSTLVLSAEDSLGTGLLLDRSVWTFPGNGDSENSSESKTVGKLKTNSFKADYYVRAHAGVSVYKDFGIVSVSAGLDAGAGISGEYTMVDYANSTAKDLTSTFSSENQHIGAVCRRYAGKILGIQQVTLMVYRATSTGAIEGESITVNVDVSKSGAKYE
jgi:hypothetical protein